MKTTKQKKVTANLSGYLVIWRHTMGDVPVGLFTTKKAALEAAEKMSRDTAFEAAKNLSLWPIVVYEKLRFAIIEFVSGKPADMTIVDRPDDGFSNTSTRKENL